MTRRHGLGVAAMVLICFQVGCQRGPESPEEIANKFLREVKRNETRAWAYYSGPSQEKIRAESKSRIEGAPYYAEVFKPEKLYSDRFNTMIAGSARVQTIQGSNATLIVQRREPAGFALPGFSPMGSKKVPAEMLMVRENGQWKIDVVSPTSDERKVVAARQRALQAELDAINANRLTNRARFVPPPAPAPVDARVQRN
jgi:hypothetical protein